MRHWAIKYVHTTDTQCDPKYKEMFIWVIFELKVLWVDRAFHKVSGLFIWLGFSNHTVTLPGNNYVRCHSTKILSCITWKLDIFWAKFSFNILFILKW